MAKSAKFSLKLLIDEKKNKVVLAEANQDFVDVLFSLLVLPMGQVARLLESHENILGCYKNLNRSVSGMGVQHFETEACKSMLVNPKSSKEIHCRSLKLNMDDTAPTRFFICQNSVGEDNKCSIRFSNFNTSRCYNCGGLMNREIVIPEDYQVVEDIGKSEDGVFVNCRSSFILTDDLRVTLNSIGAIMKVLSEQGYNGFGDLKETLIDVGFQEVLTLLGCLFTSEAPLTCTFLKEPCTPRNLKMLSSPVLKSGVVKPSPGHFVKVFVRKSDGQILYAECDEYFVDSLVSFLILPLEMACSLSNDNTTLGCVGNLCRSPFRRAQTSSYELPYYYCCRNSLFGDVITSKSRTYGCLVPSSRWESCKFIRYSQRSSLSQGERYVSLFESYPRASSETSRHGTGYMKKKTKFVVSNDLAITPMDSSSTIGLLKNMQLDFNDLEEHQLCIPKAELISILRASLISSSALTNGLSNLLVKKPKEET